MLIGLLDPDAVATADGGGLASAELHPVEGGDWISHIWAIRNPEKLHAWT